ncbi:uncharacterized protein EAF02_000275 [Botrytis sinoallii]|uniref:uncharacterized protein n=1 Tax=Botrytis sinoallii TaxID=1463999 RepID=UPI001900E664|nr:uncharacterized protein EAF02_000275 [Botrytis sinoallii]KAF7892737.1 hypothetical protein EAF02_000275 [Botrytis sinoallii]
MSHKAQAPVYNTDNGKKPPPSIEDERISPQTFYKLAALDSESALESASESESEVEEYEAYQEPYYDYRHEEGSRARSPSPEPVYRQSSSNYHRDDHRPQDTYGREEYDRPYVVYLDMLKEFRARRRAERAARATQDDEPQPSHHSRRAPSPEREEYRRPHVPCPDSTEEHRARKRAERAARATQDDEPQPSHHSRRAPSPEREEYRRPHIPHPSRDQYYSPRARSSSPPPTRPRYQPESSHKSSSSSYSSSSRTRAEKLRKMEEEREERERIKEDLRAKQEFKNERLRRYHEENLRAEELDHLKLRREEEEEDRLKDRLRQRQNDPSERYQSRSRHESRESSRYEEPESTNLARDLTIEIQSTATIMRERKLEFRSRERGRN